MSPRWLLPSAVLVVASAVACDSNDPWANQELGKADNVTDAAFVVALGGC
jgi:hypothetical protein